ncbi:hypothetical protein SAY87_005718 [Trapa incisa]|uniref:Uncharacterized protein n=1 Tax=Trapa incisa TaxID=236973 RepID=A0AAN7KCY7_9MYRT|nr:hypothetical protein SAY87_005718 [Trapa incisa]
MFNVLNPVHVKKGIPFFKNQTDDECPRTKTATAPLYICSYKAFQLYLASQHCGFLAGYGSSPAMEKITAFLVTLDKNEDFQTTNSLALQLNGIQY